MVEAVGDSTGRWIGATFFRGSKPIGGIWATPDLVVTHVCIMPTGFGVGDHQLFVVDFQEESLIGKAPFQVMHFTSCRLNTKVSSRAVRKYLSQLEKNLEHH
jgi:hypothetical protein